MNRATLVRLALVSAIVLSVVAGFSRQASAQVIPGNTGSVTVNATLVRTLTLLITPGVASTFGVVSPGTGLLTDPVTNTSYFLAAPPQVVTVITNAPWTGTIKGTDVATPATSITVAAGALKYKSISTETIALPPTALDLGQVSVPTDYAAAAALPTITTDVATWGGGGAGVTSLAQIYALRVRTTDTIVTADQTPVNGFLQSASFTATVTYTASN